MGMAKAGMHQDEVPTERGNVRLEDLHKQSEETGREGSPTEKGEQANQEMKNALNKMELKRPLGFTTRASGRGGKE